MAAHGAAPAAANSFEYSSAAALPLGAVPLVPAAVAVAAAARVSAAGAAAGAADGAGGADAAPLRCAVLYVTSVRALRAVWQSCRAAQKLLEELPFECVTKDVSMSKELLAELRTLLGLESGAPPLPALVLQGADGARVLAAPEALDALIKQPGALEAALRAAGAAPRASGTAGIKCVVCGDGGYRICPTCHGSRKVAKPGSAGAPPEACECNENGMVLCACRAQLPAPGPAAAPPEAPADVWELQL